MATSRFESDFYNADVKACDIFLRFDLILKFLFMN